MIELTVFLIIGIGMIAQYYGYRKGHKAGASSMYDMLYSKGERKGKFVVIRLAIEPDLD
jgi:hypothetical protein